MRDDESFAQPSTGLCRIAGKARTWVPSGASGRFVVLTGHSGGLRGEAGGPQGEGAASQVVTDGRRHRPVSLREAWNGLRSPKIVITRDFV